MQQVYYSTTKTVMQRQQQQWWRQLLLSLLLCSAATAVVVAGVTGEKYLDVHGAERALAWVVLCKCGGDTHLHVEGPAVLCGHFAHDVCGADVPADGAVVLGAAQQQAVVLGAPGHAHHTLQEAGGDPADTASRHTQKHTTRQLAVSLLRDMPVMPCREWS